MCSASLFRGKQKGISVWAVVLVILFGFMMFVLFLVFATYLNIQNCELAAAACSNRQSAYCLDWWKNDHNFGSGRPTWWTAINDCSKGELIENGCRESSGEDCSQLMNQNA
jgi:hypothetical protein